MKNYKRGFSSLWAMTLLITMLGALTFIAANLAYSPHHAEHLRRQIAQQEMENFVVGTIAQARIGKVYIDSDITNNTVSPSSTYTTTTQGTALPAGVFNYNWDMPEHQLVWTRGDYSYTQLASYNELAFTMASLPQVAREQLNPAVEGIIGNVGNTEFVTPHGDATPLYKKGETQNGGAYVMEAPEFTDVVITGNNTNTQFSYGSAGWGIVFVDVSLLATNTNLLFDGSGLDASKYKNNHVWYLYGTPTSNIAIKIADSAPVLISPTIGKGEFTPTLDVGASYLMLGDPANLP